MVDCGASKCLQERRNFKKELLSWTKKVPLLIGLEEVSKVVLGRKFSRKVLDITHFGEKRQVGEDWEPQENCTFCDRKSKFFGGYQADPNPGCINGDLKDQSPIINTTPIDIGGKNSSFTKVGGNSNSSTVINHNNPQCHNLMNKVNHSGPTSRFHPNHSAVMTSDYYIMPPTKGGVITTSDPDQPLDLTMPGKKIGGTKPGTKLSTPTKGANSDGTPTSSRRRDTGNGQKKVYTEEELAAAVSDIRSGKIGTRRAAALYGIPRSTLRNKMCRLELLEAAAKNKNSDSSSATTKTICAPPSNSDSVTGNTTNTASVSPTSSLVPKLTVRDLLQNGNGCTYKDDDEDGSEGDRENQDRKFDEIGSKHDLGAGIKRPFGMPPLFYNSQYMLECERAFQLSNPYSYDMKLPYLQDLIWRYAQERIDSATGGTNKDSNERNRDIATDLRNNNDGSATTEAISALNLQIPTLPSSSEHYVSSLNSSPTRASETQDADSPPFAQGSAAGGLLGAAAMAAAAAGAGHMSGDMLKDVISKTLLSENMMKNHFNQLSASGLLPPPPLTPVSSDPQSSRPSSCDPILSSPSQPVFPNPYDGFYLPPNGLFPHHLIPVNGQLLNRHTPQDEPPIKKHKFDIKPTILPASPSKVRNFKFPVNSNSSNIPKVATPVAVNDVSVGAISQQTGSDDKSQGKKTRPKRGQYRKYNHELLMEAVRAVQRGEMSVHRAGSYYGVPHSTLEYKVKERHLLRQKKPREPRKKQNGVTTSNTAASTDDSVNNTSEAPDNALRSNDNSPCRQPTGTEDSVLDMSNQSMDIDSEKQEHATSPMKENEKDHEKDIKNLNDKFSTDEQQLKAAQSLHASLLMGSLGGLPPNFPPLPPHLPPLGFGWPPLMNGNFPFPLPDPALAASLFSNGASGSSLPGLSGSPPPGINTSASELLKKLQQKVQSENGAEILPTSTTEKKTSSEDSNHGHEDNNDIVDMHGNGNQSENTNSSPANQITENKKSDSHENSKPSPILCKNDTEKTSGVCDEDEVDVDIATPVKTYESIFYAGEREVVESTDNICVNDKEVVDDINDNNKVNVPQVNGESLSLAVEDSSIKSVEVVD